MLQAGSRAYYANLDLQWNALPIGEVTMACLLIEFTTLSFEGHYARLNV